MIVIRKVLFSRTRRAQALMGAGLQGSRDDTRCIFLNVCVTDRSHLFNEIQIGVRLKTPGHGLQHEYDTEMWNHQTATITPFIFS